MVVTFILLQALNAYRKLSKFVGKEIHKPLALKDHIKPIEKPSIINKAEILKKITNYYHNTFKENQRGAEYLKKRGITNPDIYRDHKLGFVDGSMKNTLNPEIT